MKRHFVSMLGLFLCANFVIVCNTQASHVETNDELFKGKVVLVTGGAGYLGMAVVKEVLKYDPKQVIIFSRDEVKHFHFLELLGHNSKVKSVLGDVRDYVGLIAATQGVDIVIHAAALKRVDAIETNVEESIKTNAVGSCNVFNACIVNKVKRAVFVSTDKSCSPISAYGAGKFVAEKIFTNYDRKSVDTVFTAVRFGNIIGSTGSIMPIFLEKIKRGENIPLTDPRMTRFMITKEEATDVIFDALRYGKGGEIFIKQVPSVKIVDLIELLIQASRSKSNVVLIGIRPGERTYEALLSEVEILRAYEFNGSYVVTPGLKHWLNGFDKHETPLYIKEGKPLKNKFTKELISDDVVISKEELEVIFDKFVGNDANGLFFKKEPIKNV